MFHNKIKALTLLASFAFTLSLIAEEATEEINKIEVQDEIDQSDSNTLLNTETATTTTSRGPRIKAQYYSADAVQAIPRLKALTKQEPQYNKILFKLEGFPKNQEIVLEIKRLAGIDPKNYEHKVSFTIQDDDTMLIKNTDQRIQTVISSSHGFLPGERVFYRFRTVDGTISKEISGVPTPAEIKDKDHRTVIRAELASINPTVYKISLPTMKDGEQYELKSISVGETLKAKPKYAKNKPFHFSPGSKGNSQGGEAVLEIRKKSGKVYSIQLPWGTSLQSYLTGKKVYSPKP